MFKTTRTVNAFCPHPFQRLKVTPEGNVSMCCFQYRDCLGNILFKSFEDIWFGPVAKKIREMTANKEFHPSCLTESCPYRYKPLVDQPVEHFTYPREFELDLPTQHCNIGGEDPSPERPACLMCERHLYMHKHVDRLNEVCVKLRPYVRYIRALHIQGIAEAFWKDRIFEIFDHLGVEKYKEKVTVSTTTNGTILTKARRERWFDYPLSSCTFSIDASTPETFKLIRRIDAYDAIVRNLMAFAEERKPGQGLRIHNNINLFNINEVVGMVEVAARAKVDFIDFNATYNTPGICVDENSAWLFHKAQQDIMAAGEKYGVKVTFMRNLSLDYEIEPRLVEITMPGVKDVAEKLAVPVETIYKMAEESPHIKIRGVATL
jgi:MoaA/NifB/PqqE/SkfB family radical SAM enzyme